jgi:hypothetical protein
VPIVTRAQRPDAAELYENVRTTFQGGNPSAPDLEYFVPLA